ncbi:MAG: tRNA (adenosine(37)-N6)-threonylcarbamoyltransferase complex ATPase subunit type 1 TsaE [Desulfofustis sp.]|nr:tRNA (adenosine(37)-N6)-threonylcarbamoyltransferase complex ATPase subunit type 1 TsaE [Desulfofustis sp.]
MYRPSPKIVLNSPEQTSRLGSSIGSLCAPGDVIALGGDLGAGKTTLAQAIADGSGIDVSEYVCSPSFALLHEYHGRIPIYHMDFYRLQSADDVVALGLDEYFDRSGITVIEWYERAATILPGSTLFVDLVVIDELRREVSLHSSADSWQRRIREVLARTTTVAGDNY